MTTKVVSSLLQYAEEYRQAYWKWIFSGASDSDLYSVNAAKDRLLLYIIHEWKRGSEYKLDDSEEG